jgi:adenosine deaminase
MAAQADLITESRVTPEFVARLPKVELHVHLEGSLAPETILRFAQRNGVALPATTPADLRAHYVFHSLQEFIRVYLMCAGTLREPRDFGEATSAFLEFEASQNVRYVEAFIAPKIHVHNGVDIDALLEAILEAADESTRRLGIRFGLIVDVGRLFGPELSIPLARAAVRHRGQGVVAIGLGGDESTGLPRKWQESFDIAHEGGLHCTSHGGEVGGPESVWSAVLDLGVERVGHAIGAVGDPDLVAYLAEKQIALELCPQSNVQIGAVPTLAAHPLSVFRAAGALVTVNSDDPAIFANPLNEEYLAVARAFRLSPHELCRIALAAAEACFLPPAEKALLVEQMTKEMDAALAGIGCLPLFPVP